MNKFDDIIALIINVLCINLISIQFNFQQLYFLNLHHNYIHHNVNYNPNRSLVSEAVECIYIYSFILLATGRRAGVSSPWLAYRLGLPLALNTIVILW